MFNWNSVIAWWIDNISFTQDLYQFYYSIKKNKHRYESPFDFMEFQKPSKTPLYDEQYTLFAIAFLDNTLKCSQAERVLLWIWAIYSLELLMKKPYFSENAPYYLEVSRNLESLLSQFSWEEIYRICGKHFLNVDIIKILSRYKIDTYLR